MSKDGLIDYPPVGGTSIALERINKRWDEFYKTASKEEIANAYKMTASGFKIRDDLLITSYAYDLVAANAPIDIKLMLARNIGAKHSYRILASYNNPKLHDVLLQNPELDAESLLIIYNYVDGSHASDIGRLCGIRKHVNCPANLRAKIDDILAKVKDGEYE